MILNQRRKIEMVVAVESFRRAFAVILASAFFFTACAPHVQRGAEPPPFQAGFMNARWAYSVEQVKDAIATDGNRLYKDSSSQPPCAIYASGVFLGFPAIFNYFFTPKTGLLYRVDVTFDRREAFGVSKDTLISEYGDPVSSRGDVCVWLWENRSTIVLQRDETHVQISYCSGPMLGINYRERQGDAR